MNPPIRKGVSCGMKKGDVCPPIPKDYTYQEGRWDTGLVISRNRDHSEFVWVPAMSLDADVHYRRDKGDFLRSKRFENPDLTAQIENIKKYGGFYLSRYSISKTDRGLLQSVKNAVPVSNINQRDALLLAATFETGDVTSHLPYGIEMNAVYSWLIESGQLTMQDIQLDNALRETRSRTTKIFPTGTQETTDKNGLYDIIGNLDEWTQDSFDAAYIRGCGSMCTYPKTIRCYYVPYPCYYYAGFRVALCL